MATKTETPDPASKAIKGENQDIDLKDQIEKARGTEEAADDKGGKVDSKVTAAAKAAATPEMNLRDAAKEAREEHLRSLGVDPAHPGGGYKKVEPAKIKEKMYVGDVTCESVSGETHERISAKINLPSPKGEEYVWYAFKVHHMTAMREYFKIDPDNETDPMLRTHLE